MAASPFISGEEDIIQIQHDDDYFIEYSTEGRYRLYLLLANTFRIFGKVGTLTCV